MDKNVLVNSMKKLFQKFFVFFCIFYFSFLNSQIKTCLTELVFYAYSLPIDGVDWYVPIKYDVNNDLIDLEIIRGKNNNEELFIRFKIIETIQCKFINDGNLDIIYKVVTYNEEKNVYAKKISEIQFKFFDCKGKIYIRHPNFPVIESDGIVF